MAALEKASVDDDLGTFSNFIANFMSGLSMAAR